MNTDREQFNQKYLNLIWDCTRCPARYEAKLPVPPIGNPKKAFLLIVGRNPGRNEDIENIPFIGDSGQMVMQFLNAAKIEPEEAVITNIMLCHTKANRKPTKTEILTCSPYVKYLYSDMPNLKIILTLGDQATRYFLPQLRSITEQTGELFETKIKDREITILPCVHPGGIMRQPKLKSNLAYAAFVLLKLAKEVRGESL